MTAVSMPSGVSGKSVPDTLASAADNTTISSSSSTSVGSSNAQTIYPETYHSHDQLVSLKLNQQQLINYLRFSPSICHPHTMPWNLTVISECSIQMADIDGINLSNSMGCVFWGMLCVLGYACHSDSWWTSYTDTRYRVFIIDVVGAFQSVQFEW